MAILNGRIFVTLFVNLELMADDSLDLFQAEKKITVGKAKQIQKMIKFTSDLVHIF